MDVKEIVKVCQVRPIPNAPYYVELNASTLSYEHIKSLIDNGINTTRTRFTFNFYPKLYTGHDIIDVYNKTKICNEVAHI